jgi:hypothetical protein
MCLSRMYATGYTVFLNAASVPTQVNINGAYNFIYTPWLNMY